MMENRRPSQQRADASPDVEVAIVGAGPGGSAAAIALARAGHEVLLVEKKRFPRDKVCGGCVSGNGVARLKQLLGREHDLPGTAGRGVTFVMGNYRVTHQPADGTTRLVPRRALDAELVAAAIASGAQAWFGQAAQLRGGERGWSLEVGDRLVRPRHLLLASGLGALAGKLPIAGIETGRRLISQQWVMPLGEHLPPLGCVEMHWLRGGYVGLATPDASGCVAALAALAPHRADTTALAQLYQLNPSAPLWKAIPRDAPQRYQGHGCGGFPWRPSRLGDRNVLLVGDAAGFEEPFSGEGIGQALHSGMVAAAAVHQAGGDVETALRLYSTQLGRHHRWIRRRTQLVSRCLHHPLVQTVARLPPVLPRQLTTRLLAWMHVHG